MSRPAIAIDIDEVLGEYAPEFVKFSNQRWGTNLTVKDYSEHWSELWQITHQETGERVKVINTSGLVARIKPIADANAVMRELGKTYDIILVTARSLMLEKETRAWLEKNYHNIVTDIYFAGMFDGDITDHSYIKTKASVYQQIHPAFVVDDQIKHCQAAADLGINTILFGDYPWNQDVSDSPLITRCRDWNEVLAHITSRS